MYISIDMTGLCFLHKHASLNIVSGLDFIRAKHDDTCILSTTDYQAFDFLTDKQLSGLYLNTVGQTPTCFGTQLRMALLELADKFPVTDADEKEVHVQCLHLEARNPKGIKGFFYAKGSFVPTEAQPLLFPKIPFTAQDSQNATRRLTARTVQLTPQVSAVPVGVVAAPVVRAPAARPRSGVCAQIWEALDLDVKMTGLTPPRNRVKELALKNGWHLSTAGTQYGAWLKAQTPT